MVQAKLAHVASGCNANTNALSILSYNATSSPTHENYCGAYASKNAVCLLSNSVKSGSVAAPLKVVETLKHREAANDSSKITSLRMLSGGLSLDVRVLAGDSEGRVFIWTKESDGQWKIQKIYGDMETLPAVAIAAVAGVVTRTRWIYIAAFSNGMLAVFEQKDRENVKLLRQLELGRKSIKKAVDMTVFYDEKDKEQGVLVAAGGVDGKVYLLEVTEKVTKLMELEGHEDWIRSLAFERQRTDARDELKLASASQDHKIRLWTITTSRGDAGTRCENGNYGFQAHGCHSMYTVSFDALLLGHEDWVTCVQWMDNGSALLSSSMDNTLIVWIKPSDAGGSWAPSFRVGEIGGNGLLSAGVLPACDGRLNLIALGFMGQLERWEQQSTPPNPFLPAISVNGHVAEVTDLSWSPGGEYFVSVSLDQTARILVPFSSVDSMLSHTVEWFEVSRAQVHGYDINCACFVLGHRPENDKFVSGADEKILRVFEAPDEVQQLVQMTRNKPKLIACTLNDTNSQVRTVQHAYLPELSLTNKVAQADASSVDKDKRDGYAKLNDLISLPVGVTLGRKTLWPEVRKLYGHGNELLTVTSSYTGDLIASACKSREERNATVRLWNTKDWSEAQEPLGGHKSSVVQLAFSRNDQYLLSVSKDRHFCLYERKRDSEQKFALVKHVKAHKRIVWSCSWNPDSTMFALGSRDQSFSLWWETRGDWSRACEPVTLNEAVTAVAFAPCSMAGSVDFLAVGLETGAIQFFTVSNFQDESTTVVCSMVGKVAWELSPSSAVLRLAWRPTSDEKELVLAAASSDNSVRVYNVNN